MTSDNDYSRDYELKVVYNASQLQTCINPAQHPYSETTCLHGVNPINNHYEAYSAPPIIQEDTPG